MTSLLSGPNLISLKILPYAAIIKVFAISVGERVAASGPI
jgi:hypothetical protein